MLNEISALASTLPAQIAMAIVFVTGIIRGFSGFGSGMIIGPSVAALFSPITSLAMLTIIDTVPTLALVWGARRHVVWREVLPVVIGYAILVPLGVWTLTSGDPDILRWFISVSILVVVILLWSGWRYKGSRSVTASLAFGGLGGFMGAAAALPGPAVLIYWISETAKAAIIRANMIYYLLLTDLLVIAGYLYGDVYTAKAIFLALLCIPGYLVGMLIGVRFFNASNEHTYRTVAFSIILVAAITSLPLLDDFLRL